MTVATWTLGGGAADAETPLLPHPTDARSAEPMQLKTRNLNRKLFAAQPLELPQLCRLTKDLRLAPYRWLHIASPFLLITPESKGQQRGGGGTNPASLDVCGRAPRWPSILF